MTKTKEVVIATRDAVAKALDAFMPAVDMRFAYLDVGDIDRYTKIVNTYRDMDALVKNLNGLLARAEGKIE
jgi:hypothetical protein